RPEDDHCRAVARQRLNRSPPRPVGRQVRGHSRASRAAAALGCLAQGWWNIRRRPFVRTACNKPIRATNDLGPRGTTCQTGSVSQLGLALILLGLALVLWVVMLELLSLLDRPLRESPQLSCGEASDVVQRAEQPAPRCRGLRL